MRLTRRVHAAAERESIDCGSGQTMVFSCMVDAVCRRPEALANGGTPPHEALKTHAPPPVWSGWKFLPESTSVWLRPAAMTLGLTSSSRGVWVSVYENSWSAASRVWNC